jgi:hypothetical protein
MNGKTKFFPKTFLHGQLSNIVCNQCFVHIKISINNRFSVAIENLFGTMVARGECNHKGSLKKLLFCNWKLL